jgi:hypothetical protein
MYFVCDQNMQIVSEWVSLVAAKASAKNRKQEFQAQSWFVCGNNGMVIAGY